MPFRLVNSYFFEFTKSFNYYFQSKVNRKKVWHFQKKVNMWNFWNKSSENFIDFHSGVNGKCLATYAKYAAIAKPLRIIIVFRPL